MLGPRHNACLVHPAPSAFQISVSGGGTRHGAAAAAAAAHPVFMTPYPVLQDVSGQATAKSESFVTLRHPTDFQMAYPPTYQRAAAAAPI